MIASKIEGKNRDVDQMIDQRWIGGQDREIKAAIDQLLAEAQKDNKAFVEGLLEIRGLDAEGLTHDMVESIIMDLVKGERDRKGRGLLSYDLWRQLGGLLVEREECDMTIGSAYGAAIRASKKDGVRVTIMVEDEKGRRKKERVVEPPK